MPQGWPNRWSQYSPEDRSGGVRVPQYLRIEPLEEVAYEARERQERMAANNPALVPTAPLGSPLIGPVITPQTPQVQPEGQAAVPVTTQQGAGAQAQLDWKPLVFIAVVLAVLKLAK